MRGAFASSVVLLLAPAPFVVSCDRTPANAPTAMAVNAGGKTFTCRVALDPDSRELGMGGVTAIGPDEGMLFAFPDAQDRTFWMKGCVIDLDIAFMDAMGFVTAVHTMPKEAPQGSDESDEAYRARLVRYPSAGRAKYALEVAPGTLAPLGIRRGSRIEFDREALKPFIR